jgi:hypothetical protein
MGACASRDGLPAPLPLCPWDVLSPDNPRAAAPPTSAAIIANPLSGGGRSRRAAQFAVDFLAVSEPHHGAASAA